MAYFPLFHQTSCLNTLIVGGGLVANKRAQALTKVGVHCDLITKVCLPDLHTLIERHGGKVTLGAYKAETDQEAYQLIIAATDNKQLNHSIAQQAIKAGKLINVVDDPSAGNVIFAATVDRHPLTIAINNGGASPILSRLLRQQLDQFVPKHYGHLAALVGRYRQQVKDTFSNAHDRTAFWENVLQGSVAEAMFSGQQDKAEALLQHKLNQAKTVGKDNQPMLDDGQVYLIGAGPGDPDLLTLRAFRLLQQTDVVFYDALVSEEIMALIPAAAEKIYVGKRRSQHSVPQENINQLLVDHAQQGKRVARLKGGDPFVFGRGGEEIQTLSAHQIPFQVVPGISAANGCSAYAGIPLTHRDHAQSVRFVTGQLKNNTLDLNWLSLTAEQQTIVFYMGLNSLPIICTKLMEHGMSADMPIALIEKGTTRQQRVIVSNLQTMPKQLANYKLESPTLLIVGTVVNLHNKLAWFDK